MEGAKNKECISDCKLHRLVDKEAMQTVEENVITEDDTKRVYVSPVERALDMVSDYCLEKVRNYFFGDDGAPEEYLDKSEAYLDVRDFIQDFIERYRADWEIQEKEINSVDENDELNYYKKEAEWYKMRMEKYRKSFFMVCNLIDTCGVPEFIKYFVKQEELRY